MKTDVLFYHLLSQYPQLLFDLAQIEQSARGHQFDSIEIKQTAFRIDGVLKPPDDQPHQAITFAEIQFQKDKGFYSRFFAEIFLYLRHKKPINPWQAVVIFSQDSIEDHSEKHLYQHLLAMPNVHIIYLKRLLKQYENQPKFDILKIIVGSEQTAKYYAQTIVQDIATYSTQYGIRPKKLLEFVETMMIYKFPKITREEVINMLGLNDDELKHTQYYKDLRQEAHQEGRQEGKQLFFKNMLEKRFGILPKAIEKQLEYATEVQLEQWSELIFTAKHLADIFEPKHKH